MKKTNLFLTMLVLLVVVSYTTTAFSFFGLFDTNVVSEKTMINIKNESNNTSNNTTKIVDKNVLKEVVKKPEVPVENISFHFDEKALQNIAKDNEKVLSIIGDMDINLTKLNKYWGILDLNYNEDKARVHFKKYGGVYDVILEFEVHNYHGSIYTVGKASSTLKRYPKSIPEDKQFKYIKKVTFRFNRLSSALEYYHLLKDILKDKDYTPTIFSTNDCEEKNGFYECTINMESFTEAIVMYERKYV